MTQGTQPEPNKTVRRVPCIVRRITSPSLSPFPRADLLPSEPGRKHFQYDGLYILNVPYVPDPAHSYPEK
jgi:hypothetical protein